MDPRKGLEQGLITRVDELYMNINVIYFVCFRCDSRHGCVQPHSEISSEKSKYSFICRLIIVIITYSCITFGFNSNDTYISET